MREFRESTKLTEDQFDETHGGTANGSPLHLSAEQLPTFNVHYLWTHERGETFDAVISRLIDHEITRRDATTKGGLT
jgi:hypothetical protein